MENQISQAANIGYWCFAATSIAGFAFIIFRLVTGILDRNREQPRPGETYATKQVVNHLEKRIDKMETSIDGLRQELKKDKMDMMNAGSKRARDIYTHIDEVRKEIKDDITGIHRRLDDVIKAITRQNPQ